MKLFQCKVGSLQKVKRGVRKKQASNYSTQLRGQSSTKSEINPC